jgi:hypothetical protein
MFLTILNFSGRTPRTGFVLSATGLYFFPVLRCMDVTSVSGDVALLDEEGGSGGTSTIIA